MKKPSFSGTIYIISEYKSMNCLSTDTQTPNCSTPIERRKLKNDELHIQFSSVQLSRVWHFATPWTAAHQASLSITNSWSWLKLLSIEVVMPSNRLILCCPLLLPSILPSIRVFSNKSVLRIRWPKLHIQLTPNILYYSWVG